VHPFVPLAVSIDRHVGRLLTEGGLALAILGALAVAVGAARAARAWNRSERGAPARAWEKVLNLLGFVLIAGGSALALVSAVAVHTP
jgi:hypothetical protein